jgi:hypothetical protein
MVEDRILVWRFNRSDPAALCRIYDKYRDGLFKFEPALTIGMAQWLGPELLEMLGTAENAKIIHGRDPAHRAGSCAAAVQPDGRPPGAVLGH